MADDTPEYTVQLLFELEHPKHGHYWIFYDPQMDTYGLSKGPGAPWCAYASLAALFSQKGL